MPPDVIREEHRRLAVHLEGVRAAADGLDTLGGRDAFELIDVAWRFLVDDLVPHMTSEERVVYMALTNVLGTPEPAELLAMDHEAIAALVDELTVLRRHAAGVTTVDPADLRSLRRVLYSIYAVVSAHIAKEERLMLPMLDGRLSPRERTDLLRELRRRHATVAGSV